MVLVQSKIIIQDQRKTQNRVNTWSSHDESTVLAVQLFKPDHIHSFLFRTACCDSKTQMDRDISAYLWLIFIINEQLCFPALHVHTNHCCLINSVTDLICLSRLYNPSALPYAPICQNEISSNSAEESTAEHPRCILRKRMGEIPYV
ncbi:hypothetical protein BLNAU_5172 [Blattamonas nauphoetae]|uniref:Uncharacterized protein n=1 Tax=Blattamonas nauphoetae TaxID=2049346 RepID=A0ABQ9XJB4_9EUKA|nr:hypothetical protein BLNAU_14353 [Blattamonas nauphoetae]KAK2959975.1 hypothetical protein BLNAU_5172 [Blattamonas nauphoetae]